MSLTLIVLYRPPSANIDFYDKFKEMLKQCDFKKEVIVMGDFNIHWDDNCTRKKLQQIMDGFNLVQMVKGPTRITNTCSTLIDLIFTNYPERITKSYNMLTGLSDHNMVLITRKLTRKRFAAYSGKKEFTGIPRSNQEQFHTAIRNMNWDTVLLDNDLEIISQKFTECLQTKIYEYVVTIKHKNRKFSFPWLSDDIKQLMKDRTEIMLLKKP